jgi:glutamate formiminotransferase
VLTCVVNISEGRDTARLAELDDACGTDLLDRHTDPHHHRSVFTLVGEEAPRRLAAAAVARLDLSTHEGVHPRLGVVDVVPFVPLAGSSMDEALGARDAFAGWAVAELGVPCFLYGPDRSLPEVRRRAWRDLAPDVTPHRGPDVRPDRPHPTAGSTCVGAREVLVAYNVWLATPDVTLARAIAAAVRGPAIRALGLAVGDRVQVSMNLIRPDEVGPAQAYDLVAARAPAAGAELVGLLPGRVLDAIPPARWSELDVATSRTLEARLTQR